MATNKPKSTIGTRVIHGLVVASACVAVAVGILEGDNSISVNAICALGTAASVVAAVGWMWAEPARWPYTARFFRLFLVCALAVAVIPQSVSRFRTRRTIAKLEELYFVISQKGAPFPDSVDADLKASEWWLKDHGYWVSDDRSSFELIRYAGSDSYILEYPAVSGGGWKWRGCGHRSIGHRVEKTPNKPE